MQLLVEVTGDELAPDRVRVHVIEPAHELELREGRLVLSSDFWDGGPPVAEAVAGFVTTWLHEASWLVMPQRGVVAAPEEPEGQP